MTPTTEQVAQWAREARMAPPESWNEHWLASDAELQAFAALAYAAGAARDVDKIMALADAYSDTYAESVRDELGTYDVAAARAALLAALATSPCTPQPGQRQKPSVATWPVQPSFPREE